MVAMSETVPGLKFYHEARCEALKLDRWFVLKDSSEVFFFCILIWGFTKLVFFFELSRPNQQKI